MNRQQRRQLEREKSKQIEKDTKEHINKLKRLKPTSLRLRASEWAMNLKEKEQIYLSTMMLENSRHDINAYIEAYSISLNNNLDNEELIKKIQDDVYAEGLKVQEYRDNGGDYIMAIKNNETKIIKDYEKGIANNIKESDIIKDLAVNYKLTQNSVKSIIKDYKKSKEKTCTSKTCPFAKKRKCTNEIVLSGKDECRQLNVEECKVTVDESIIKPKEEIKEEKVSPIYKVNHESVKGNKEEVEKMKKEKPKFKVIKETVIRDVEGEHGIYHIENGVMKVEDVAYTNAEDIKQDYSDTVQALELAFQETVRKLKEDKKKNMQNAESSKNEALAIMEEFM